MKVYELMNKLSECKAGAKVRISLLKTLDELPEYKDGLREVDFEVKDVDSDGDAVMLDGWCE